VPRPPPSHVAVSNPAGEAGQRGQWLCKAARLHRAPRPPQRHADPPLSAQRGGGRGRACASAHSCACARARGGTSSDASASAGGSLGYLCGSTKLVSIVYGPACAPGGAARARRRLGREGQAWGALQYFMIEGVCRGNRQTLRGARRRGDARRRHAGGPRWRRRTRGAGRAGWKGAGLSSTEGVYSRDMGRGNSRERGGEVEEPGARWRRRWASAQPRRCPTCERDAACPISTG
jgi:hypothetical protein